jgi:Delta3-Delta2-enoyl-CoA isomerase
MMMNQFRRSIRRPVVCIRNLSRTTGYADMDAVKIMVPPEDEHALKTVAVERRDGGVCVLWMNRAKKKNALDFDMYNELGGMLHKLNRDPGVKGVVIIGKGDYFSSGNDLSNFSQLMNPLKMAASARRILYEFVDSFIAFEKPLVAAVNGPAFGIAVTVLGLCCKVVATPSATFKTPFAELAQAPEGCSSYTFPQIMGAKKANEVLWDGNVLNAYEAKAYGLITDLVDGPVKDNNKLLRIAIEECEKVIHEKPSLTHLDRIARRLQITDPKQKQNLLSDLDKTNYEESEVLEKAWISNDCFNALGKFLISRKMTGAAYVLKALNYSGKIGIWKQPMANTPRPGFRNKA